VPQITDLIDAQIAAYRERNLDKFPAFYSDEVQITDVNGNILMDHSVMAEQYGQLFRDSPNLAVEIASRIVVGNTVIDEERVTG